MSKSQNEKGFTKKTETLTKPSQIYSKAFLAYLGCDKCAPEVNQRALQLFLQRVRVVESQKEKGLKNKNS